jgi:predicted nucleic acid-binding protein
VPRYLLDSTVHIQWARGVPTTREWLLTALLGDDDLLTSAISVSEVYAGAHIGELERLAMYFGEMDVLPVSHADAVVAGRMRSNRARRGRQLHLADALIAAPALERKLTVVTANARDFEGLGIDVVALG